MCKNLSFVERLECGNYVLSLCRILVFPKSLLLCRHFLLCSELTDLDVELSLLEYFIFLEIETETIIRSAELFL